MQCEHSKCKGKLNKPSKCNKCQKKFCSKSCMIDHYFEAHKANEEPENGNNKSVSTSPSISVIAMKNRRSSVASYFIKKGQFLQEIKENSYFDWKNFEKVKIGRRTHVLGAGAFGDVYLLKNKLDGKFYAVKEMQKEKILDAGAKLDIVKREIDIHRRLVHENIVRLYSYHEDEEMYYLILEYANSGTLFQLIKKSKGMEENYAFKYFIQTCAAVHFLHEQKLIHRDIKPENLLLNENDNVKLCDFGWCIELEIGNRTTFCGTIEYMAPEIVKEMPYDKAIDVWSLGILLYELLHGYSPFKAENGDEEEEYENVIKNILKFKFQIKADVSDSCRDLLSSKLFD